MRILALSFLGLLLLYHILTKGLSAYLADTNPEAAVFLNSNNPTALVNLAEDKLAADPSFNLLDPVLAPPRNAGPGSTVAKGDDAAAEEAPATVTPLPAVPAAAPTTLDAAALTEIRDLAERAIANDPLNARAFRILGQISERTSDEMQTEKLMSAAVERSMLESVAVYWMIRKSFQDQDYPETLRYADILMRTRPQALSYIMPIMGKMAELPGASDDLKQLLSISPPWRPQFFAYFPQAITDARTPLDILLSVKESTNPPSAAELRPYLDFLIQRGFYDLAYYTWLQFLPPEKLAQAGHLYNAGFDTPPSGTPFDWVLTKGTGVTVQVAAKADRPGERALHLQFGPGRVDYRDVTQLIMLIPGAYQFQGQYKGDLVSERGLEWRVICAGKDQNVIGRGLVTRGATAQWKDLEFSFTVPETGCPAQYVKLVFDARSASERFISGNIWFDDFKIAREQPTEAPESAVPPTAPSEATQPPAAATEQAVTPMPDIPQQPSSATEPAITPAAPETSQPPAALAPAAPPEISPQPSEATQPATTPAPPPEVSEQPGPTSEGWLTPVPPEASPQPTPTAPASPQPLSGSQ